ncbi:ATP synthase subunit b 2 [Bienertia sinuspersici]
MEGLKKLEEIQTMLMFLDSQSFVSPISSSLHSDSQRFLAHFLLFLMEPCGKLTIDNKCTLISQHLPKISPSFLEKAFEVFPGKKMGILDDPMSVNLVKEKTNDHSHGSGMYSAHEDMALVGLDAMQRANSTLEDFCRSYFMFHGMDVEGPESIFKYLPVLSFTESYIYQLDTLNEKMVNVTTAKEAIQDRRSNEEANSTSTSRFNKDFESDPFRPLKLLLQHHGLLTERIREELSFGVEYWALERRLCGAPKQVEISIEDALRAIHLKSFDYRVLNLLLYQLRGEEEDVVENNFNILRMFVRIYGASAAPTMLAKSIAEAEEKYEKLSKALDPQLSSSYHKRCEEATKEGGKISGFSLGSWTIPPLIVDEELYRSSMKESPT